MAPLNLPALAPLGETLATTENAGCVLLPLDCPMDSARHAFAVCVGTDCIRFIGRNGELPSQARLHLGEGQMELGHSGGSGPSCLASVLFLARLLPCALAGESSFHALFLTRLQVEGMTFYFLDDIFLLHFALETAQSIFKRFTLLKPYFGQTDTPPNSSRWTD